MNAGDSESGAEPMVLNEDDTEAGILGEGIDRRVSGYSSSNLWIMP